MKVTQFTALDIPRSIRQIAQKSSDIRLRKAPLTHRNPSPRHHLHSIYDGAADRPAQFTQFILLDSLQPSPSSFTCPAAAFTI